MRNVATARSLALGCATAGLLLLAGPASAGGPSTGPSRMPAGAQWSGFYAGGEVGGAWSSFDWTYTNPNYFNTLGAILLGSDFSQHASGVIGEIFAGYNFQTGP